jgi:hypothetical protein
VLRERARQLRKIVYSTDENWKERMPKKNEDNDLGHELLYCDKLEKVIESDEVLRSLPKVKEKLNLLKETIEDTQDHYTLSKDSDARTGHKTADTSFFGFKTHIAMTEERVITAAIVTSGEKGDGTELPALLEASQGNGIEVDTIIGDAAYSGKENLKIACEQEIKIVAKLNPSITQGYRSQENTFNYNKDAGMFVCPSGHMAIRKARQGKKGEGSNQADTYFFDVEKCKTCTLKNGCYKPNAKTKTYAVTIKSDEHLEQMEFQQTEYFKEKAKHRYKIEAKNSELKNVHGYGRASSYGIANMQMQGAMAIFTVNLKRILKLTN